MITHPIVTPFEARPGKKPHMLFAWVLAATTMASLISCISDPLTLADQDVAEVINKRFGKPAFVLPIGDVMFVSKGIDLSQRKVPETWITRYVAVGIATCKNWAASGESVICPDGSALAFEGEQDLTDGRSFSWNNWFALKASISRSDEGRFDCNNEQVKGWWAVDSAVCIPTGQGRVDKIIRNEIYRSATSNLRLVTGTIKWEWSDIGSWNLFIESEFRKRGGRFSGEKLSIQGLLVSLSGNDFQQIYRDWRKQGDASADRKFMALFKHDEFSGEWSLDLFDHAQKDEDLKMRQAFDDALRGAQRP